MEQQQGTLVEVEPKPPEALEHVDRYLPAGVGGLVTLAVVLIARRVRKRRQARVDAKVKDIHDRLPR
jgi:hypothetical protein